MDNSRTTFDTDHCGYKPDKIGLFRRDVFLFIRLYQKLIRFFSV